jgi:hypothetical protein
MRRRPKHLADRPVLTPNQTNEIIFLPRGNKEKARET